MKSLKLSFTMLAGLMMAALFFSCASIGNPSGGPRDEDPPLFVKANPAPGATGVKRQRITIDFNEIVNVKDAFTKVVVSPTSSKTPRVSSQGRRVTVQFQDTLQPNTTYVIDFGNSIEDNNEGNKLSGFSYWFSTGEDIDSLQISGMVLDALSREPQQGMLVGVYSQLDDTTFQRRRLERVAKTDDRGRFTLRGLKESDYHLFALADINNDFRWDNPDEAIAFHPFTISPYSEQTSTSDTIWNLKTGEVDSVVSRGRTRFLPNNILLNSFLTDRKSQYLVKNERIDSTRISLIFNAKSDTLPTLTLVDYPDLQDWYRLERSQHNDTLTYWISNREILSRDSLFVAAQYLRTDSAQTLQWYSDTLRLFKPRVRAAAKANASKKAKKKSKEQQRKDSLEALQPVFMNLKALSSSSQDVNRPILFEFEQPLSELNARAFHLEVNPDSVWKPVTGQFFFEPADSFSLRKYKVEYPWDYETKYRLRADSIAATGIYGNFTKPFTHEFTTKKESDYSTLILRLNGLTDSIPAFVELLDRSDKPIATAPVIDGVATLPFLTPGSYYARVVEDFNGNGIFDTGDYDSLLQPEQAFYYPKKINLKANWDLEQTWNVFEVAIDAQKPDAIKKNRPEADKNRRNVRKTGEDDEEEDEYFDPSANPFDSNSKKKRSTSITSGPPARR